MKSLQELLDVKLKNLQKLIKQLRFPAVLEDYDEVVGLKYKDRILTRDTLKDIGKSMPLVDFVKWLDQYPDVLLSFKFDKKGKKEIARILLRAYRDEKYMSWLLSTVESRKKMAEKLSKTKNIYNKTMEKFLRIIFVENKVVAIYVRLDEIESLTYFTEKIRHSYQLVRHGHRYYFFDSPEYDTAIRTVRIVLGLLPRDPVVYSGCLAYNCPYKSVQKTLEKLYEIFEGTHYLELVKKFLWLAIV